MRPRCAARAENLLMAQVCRSWRVQGTLQSLYRCAVARVGEASDKGEGCLVEDAIMVQARGVKAEEVKPQLPGHVLPCHDTIVGKPRVQA